MRELENRIKYSPITVRLKAAIRKLRINEGLNMVDGAAKLGVSRKQLEDIETTRNYGCHIELELIAKVCIAYGIDVAYLLGDFPKTINSPYLRRGSPSE